MTEEIPPRPPGPPSHVRRWDRQWADRLAAAQEAADLVTPEEEAPKPAAKKKAKKKTSKKKGS